MKFTANICFHTLTIRWVELNYCSPSILLFWLTGFSSYERDVLCPHCFRVSSYGFFFFKNVSCAGEATKSFSYHCWDVFFDIFRVVRVFLYVMQSVV